jgi:hypothetical protein
LGREEDELSEIASLEPTLAARINDEHRACETAVNAALEHALAAGELLLKVRKSCPHGTWIAWLEENFEGSVRTAQAYIRVATRRAEVEASKAQTSAPLSLDGALKALVKPKAREPEVVSEGDSEADSRLADERAARDAERYRVRADRPPGYRAPEAFTSGTFTKPLPAQMRAAIEQLREAMGHNALGGPHPPEVVAEDLLDYFDERDPRMFADAATRVAERFAAIAAELGRQASARISAEKQRRENERALHAQTKREAEDAKAVKDLRKDTLDHL